MDTLDLASTGALSGVLSIEATDNQGAAKATTLGLTGYADPALAFVAPPGTFASPFSIAAPLTGLTLAADGAVALSLLGDAPEMMNLTLISTDGPLLLDPQNAAGIAISGDATQNLVLGFASTELPQLNAALAAVNLVENGLGTLTYIARELTGPLPPSVTSGTLNYSPDNFTSQTSETWLGGNGLWQTGADWSGSFAANGATDVSIFGGETISGMGAASVLTLAAGASLTLAADVAVYDSLVATNAALDLVGSAGAPAALSAMSAGFSASSVRIENAALSIQNTLDFATQSSVLVDAAGTLDAGSMIFGAGDSLLDFGSLAGGGLALGTGAEAFLPGGGILDQAISMASGAVIDFAGLLQAGAGFGTTSMAAFTLPAGAVIEGGGTLVAGNFSESAVIDGPGTIEALGPAPLTIAAGSVSGGAQFLIDPGAVLELGAISPLYGVFNPTPLTIDSSVTLSFAPGANATQDSGLYPSQRGEQGGVLLLDYPGQFAGTITGFAPGDRIALPGLANLSLANLTGHSFVVSGTDSNGVTQSDTIHAAYAPGLSPFIETDINSNSFIGLRAAAAQLTLNDVPATQASINAVNGYQEPITGLGLLLPTANAAALSLTISAVNGLISEGSVSGGATITLTGSTGLALNDQLAELAYTPQGGGSGDTLRFTGSGGGLNGFSAAVAIAITAPATLDYQGGAQGLFDNGASWSGGNAPANGDVLSFGSHAGAADIVSGSGEAGAITVTGVYDFAGTIATSGASSGALAVDGNGMALFDANAVVSLAGALNIGDSAGAGTAGIAGSLNESAVNVAGNANAAGSLLDVSGSLFSEGTLNIGGAAAGTLDATGHLTALSMTLGSAGLLRATGTAAMALGGFNITGGTLALNGAATASGDSLAETGGMIELTDQSALAISQAANFIGGTLTVGAGAEFTAGSAIATASAATLDDAGVIHASGLTLGGAAILGNGASLASAGGVTLNSGASLSLNDAMLTATMLTIASNAILSGSGEIGGAGLGLLPVINAAGALTASGGTLTLGGDVTGNLTIATGAALDLVHGATQGTISFTGANETLILNDVAAMQDTVTGMMASDAIELVGVPAASVSIANSVVTIADPSSFGFTPAANQPAPLVASNNSGGSTITMGNEMPCFARGTLLLTPSGYRPVESLAPGDPLITETGLARGIIWIGSRVIDLATDPAAAILRPVVIKSGAFGKGLPLRNLRLSPLHAVYVDGALIPAVLLVNGATIIRDDHAQAVTYYHVELARHDVVRAEGLAVETYRDTGNRHRFAEARGVPGGMVPAVAPLVTQGAALARIREALHERAFALGYQLSHAPDISFSANGSVILARRTRKTINLIVPERGASVHILSRSSAPAETDPYSEDRRSLGICIGGIRVDGRAVLGERLEADGWHRRGGYDRGYWTSGKAIVPVEGSRVSLELIGSVPVWLAPACPGVGPII